MTKKPDAPGVALVANRTGQAIINDLHADSHEITEGLRGIQQEGLKRVELERYLKSCAALVFAYWVAKFDHPRAYLDPEREKRILARLRENGGDVSELLYAIDGGLKDDWVMGTARNVRHKNDGINYLFASRERVEQLAEHTGGYRRTELHKMVIKYMANGNGNGNGNEH